jgi:hypothetical protein
MGIRLDWEIEAEREHIRGAGEDPESKRRRRQARRRLFLVLFVALLLVAAVVGGVILRLRYVDWQIEQLLLDTVDAEVAALRLGDQTAFLAIQRSATDDWIQRQARAFEDYQSLKVTADANLTGRVLDATIDRQRGRVWVEEIINNIPYGRIWFYWRYEDGWRHVPPDYTFWGDPASYTNGSVTVSYQRVDEVVARAVGDGLAGWIASGCAVLGCTTPPSLTIEIVPDETLVTEWTAPWTLRIPSPFLTAARMDNPFDPTMQAETAQKLAEHLVAYVKDWQPAPAADAAYLKAALTSWLAGRFAGDESGSALIQTMVRNYGDAAITQLMSAVQPDSSIDILNTAAQTTSLHQLNVDWRDFLSWRLNLENQLITARDEAGFLALYDTADENVRGQAIGRFNSGARSEQRRVVDVSLESDANGVPQLRTSAEWEGGVQENILFRLINGVWRRAS